MSAKKSQASTVSFPSRLIHGVVDTFVGLAVSGAVTMPVFAALGVAESGLVIILGLLVGLVAYRYALISVFGGTLGHGITSCRVKTVNGKSLSSEAIFKRSLGILLPWTLFTYQSDGFWHDRWSKTALVRVPREKHDGSMHWYDF